MAKIRCVKKNINRLRGELQTLVDKRGVSALETIRCSQQLDQAIMDFYRARRRNRAVPSAQFSIAAD